MTPTKRVPLVACLVVATAVVLGAAGADAAPHDRVEPHEWARAMCTVVLPVAESMLVAEGTWSVLDHLPETVDDLAAQVELADRALAVLARFMRAQRTGAREAGIPAVSDGVSLMARFRESSAEFLRNVDVFRAAFARFVVERGRDETGAVRDLRDVLESRRGTLVVSFVLKVESPRLARAVRSVLVCQEVDRAVAKARPVMAAARRLVDG